jgi:hypothetical protein
MYDLSQFIDKGGTQVIWAVGDYARQDHKDNRKPDYFKVEDVHFLDSPEIDYSGLILRSEHRLYLAKFCTKITEDEYNQHPY